jgi:NADH dehydrogenase
MEPGSRASVPVVIIGGGFAGVTLAQHLEKKLDKATEIIVISRDNHLVFTPMLAEVAARTISPLHVVVAGRQMTKRTRWIAASATGIDPERRVVHFELSYGGVTSLPFGDLVLACGMDVNLGDVPGMAAHALPLKSILDAFTMGNVLIGKFEEAAIAPDRDMQAKLLTTVVIGGGFSGVEIAGHLYDLAKSVRRYYTFAEGIEPRMIVIQRGERILPELQHEMLSEFALRKLRQGGVEVLLKTGVREISKDEVHLSNGERLSYGLLAGTVGNTATALVKDSGLPLERNRLKTNGAMQVEGQDAIWALGDCAVIPNAFDGKLSPPTAQFALRQAEQLAANIHRTREGRTPAAFRFRPQGLLASIGQRNGVAEVYGVKFSGVIAWFFWRAVYFMKMPTLSRRVGIAVNWLMDALVAEDLVRIGDIETRRLRKEHYVAGDVIYRQGQPSRTLYLIEKGTAIVRQEGQEEPVARLRQGEYFGLSAVERHETIRSSTVIAESPLDVVVFDRSGLQEMSRDVLNRELVRLLELRRIRQSWNRVIERLPRVAELRVADAMVKTPELLEENETLQVAVRKLSSAVSLPVVDSNRKLIGCCGRDDVNAALAQGMDLQARARDFASPALITLAPDQSLRHAAFDYLRSGVDAAPVIDADGRLLGMFGLVEAARLLLKGEEKA